MTYNYRGAWDPNFIYDNNLPSGQTDTVSFMGALWEAQWYNVGHNPMWFSVPQNVGGPETGNPNDGPGYEWRLVTGQHVNYNPVVPSWDALTDLHIGYKAATAVTLFWNPAIVPGMGEVSSYDVYVTDVATGKAILAGSTSHTSFAVTGLDASTQYKFSITANDLTGSSGNQTQTGTNEGHTFTWNENPGKGANPLLTYKTGGAEIASDKYFSPFVDMTLGSTNILKLASETGLKDFTLAFMQSTGVDGLTGHLAAGATPGLSWGGLSATTLPTGVLIDQIHQLEQLGGDITISIGGYTGRDPAIIASEYEHRLDISEGQTAAEAHTHALATLKAEYQSVLNTYGVHSLDFDIEQDFYGERDAQGHPLNQGGDTVPAGSDQQYFIEYKGPNDDGAVTVVTNEASLKLRDEAIKALEASNKDLKITFTVATNPDGLSAAYQHVLLKAQADGVRIDVVNIMAMDYYDEDAHPDMAKKATDAATAVHEFLVAHNIDAKVGITPMIGNNDDPSEVFTVADAVKVEKFAAANDWVAGIGMWELPRDQDGGNHPGADVVADSSGTTQTDWQFSKTFVKVTKLATPGSDTITDNDSSHSLKGLAGTDTIRGYGGNDTLDGGAGSEAPLSGGTGTDTASYQSATTGVTLNLTTPANSTHDAAGDVFASIEKFLLSTHADVFMGNSSINNVDGSGGNDTLNGAAGHDVLKGGSGDDHFQFTAMGSSSTFDTIVDFVRGHDKIELKGSVFAGLSGLTDAGITIVSSGHGHATTGGDHLVYNKIDGTLWYDANGTAGGEVEIAAFTAIPTTLTHGDFAIV